MRSKRRKPTKPEDANNTIRQSEAMMALDISDAFGGSMDKAAGAVKAKAFVVVAKQDHTVTPQPAHQFRELVARAIAGIGIGLRASCAGLRDAEGRERCGGLFAEVT